MDETHPSGLGVGADEKKRSHLGWLRGLLALAALAWLVREVWTYGPDLWAGGPSFTWLLAALGCLLAGFVGQVWAWQWNLQSLGAKAPFLKLFRVYFTMNMARYLPGKFWSMAGTVALGKRLGLEAGVLTTSVVVGLVSSLVSGLLTGFGVAVIFRYERLLNPWMLVAPVVALLAVLPPVFRFWSRLLFRLMRRPGPPPYVKTGLLVRSLLHFSGVWVAYAAACACLALAVGATPVGLYAAAFPLAYLVGYAAFFAPGGLGVREGALVWLCGGGPLAVAVSLWQRLLLTFLEVVLFALSVWRGRHD